MIRNRIRLLVYSLPYPFLGRMWRLRRYSSRLSLLRNGLAFVLSLDPRPGGDLIAWRAGVASYPPGFNARSAGTSAQLCHTRTEVQGSSGSVQKGWAAGSPSGSKMQAAR